nr:MAG TPA: hypothetical protein [Bacteriophage sp.]DAV79623.1 MAG TPA: hypothetical protein [Bacteriophage sp.]
MNKISQTNVLITRDYSTKTRQKKGELHKCFKFSSTGRM